MRFLMLIPAVVACVFYVYVLVQLRRDEKLFKSPPPRDRTMMRGSEKLVSFTAVKDSPRSFPQWSRLAGNREGPAQRQVPKTHGPRHERPKHRAIPVAPPAGREEENRSYKSPKKIA